MQEANEQRRVDALVIAFELLRLRKPPFERPRKFHRTESNRGAATHGYFRDGLPVKITWF